MRTERHIFKRADGLELPLILAQSPEKGPRPLVIALHGGGWQTGQPEDILAFCQVLLENLFNKGISIAAPSYRKMDQGASIWDIVSDCMDAAAWLACNAASLGIDPGRMGAVGHSAGAHLALMLATADRTAFGYSTAPTAPVFQMRAAAAFNPPTLLYPDGSDQSLLTDEQMYALPAFLGFEYAENPAKANAACPYSYIRRGMPPVTLVVSRQDEIVDPRHSYLYYDKAMKLGADCRLIEVTNSDHSFRPICGGCTEPDFGQVQLEVCRFMCENL